MKRKILFFTIITVMVIVSLSTLVGCGGEVKSLEVKEPDTNKIIGYSLHIANINKLALVENNTTKFSININTNASKSLKRSVIDMQEILKEMSGVDIPINASSNYNIYVGTHAENLNGVHDDGFIIDVEKNYISIRGNNDIGTRNGVYYFLEEYLGVVFAAEDYTYIPKHDSIHILETRQIINPATPWRDVYSYELSRNNWASKLKINALDMESSDEELLKREDDMTDEYYNRRLNELRQYDGWGTWCHSMYKYLSPEEYFESHPEYFSLKDGKRVHKYQNIDAHLCLSNEKVYNIVEANLAKMIEANPEVKYWDFSINDNSWVAGCECDNCKRLDREAGGTGMGSLLPFLNRLARKFPDKYICTLAYFHTLKPPKNIKCEPNVVVKLCSMPGDQASSYLDPINGNAKEFHDRVVEWSNICDHIVIWDYTTNFSNLLLPFPNFAVQVDNQKFYEEHNIEGIFHQSSREVGGELANMRAYLLSKLMWNGADNFDMEQEIANYCYVYYGPNCGREIASCISKMSKRLAIDSKTLGLYDSISRHKDGYLSSVSIGESLNSINYYMKENEEKVYIDHMNELRLNLLYAQMIHPDTSDAVRENIKKEVVALAKEQGVTMAREWQSLDDFIANLDNEVLSIQKECKQPLYIGIGVTIGVILLAIILIVALKIRKTIRNKVQK